MSQRCQTRKFPIFATLLIAPHLRKPPRNRRYLSSAQGQIRRQTNQERAIAEITARGKIHRLHQDRWRRLCAEDDPMESISADLSTVLEHFPLDSGQRP